MEAEATAIGIVKQIDIDQEMQQAYLDYAMSVIVARALPDVRDGLKPVQRRILYAMHDMGLTYDREYKKSARIVGEVLGKYHPHGDSAVYEAMVRMAQDFSMRYPLVDGQGNFGSIDGDNAAAMRYTEARLARLANDLLADIEKDTVDFTPNFDGTLQEPTILPALLPNLLINGSSGIAVGMATNVPPHNLAEVCDAIVYLIDRYQRIDKITVDELMQFVQGPDFPTGGIVYRYGRDAASGNGAGADNVDLIASAYAQGRGRFIVQARAHIEEMSRNRHRIIVTELPYQTNKTNLIERIAELAREGRIEGIADLRDESDRQGMRIVIELTRTAEPRTVLAQLFHLTPMQQTFGVSLLALVDGEPRTLSLKRILQLYIEHRREIIRRRSEHDLRRARERAHILEGLLIALDNLDEVIATIRRAPDAEAARDRLMRKFKLSQLQAQAILDLQLRRLARLERDHIKAEYEEKVKLIAYLEDLLAHPAKILALIREDALQLKARYGDPRRTQIVARAQGILTARELVEERAVWVTVGANGLITVLPAEGDSRTALRAAAQTAEIALLRARTSDDLALFSANGRLARIPIHRIPSGEGGHWADLCDFAREERVTAAMILPHYDEPPAELYLALATRQGKIKRVALADVMATSGTPTVMNVEAGDELGWARLVAGEAELLVVTQQGQAIRFKVAEVRPTGLLAGGVGAIKLAANDQAIACEVVEEKGALLTVTAAGFVKRTSLAEFPTQGRFGAGVVAHKLSARTGLLVGATILTRADALAAIATARGVIKLLAARDAPEAGRSAAGKDLLALAKGDQAAALRALVGEIEIQAEQAQEKAAQPTAARTTTRQRAPAASEKAAAPAPDPSQPQRTRARRASAQPPLPIEQTSEPAPARSRKATKPTAAPAPPPQAAEGPRKARSKAAATDDAPTARRPTARRRTAEAAPPPEPAPKPPAKQPAQPPQAAGDQKRRRSQATSAMPTDESTPTRRKTGAPSPAQPEPSSDEPTTRKPAQSRPPAKGQSKARP